MMGQTQKATNQMIENLLAVNDIISQKDYNMARFVLSELADMVYLNFPANNNKNGAKLSHILPLTRRLLDTHVPSVDPHGYIQSIRKFAEENFEMAYLNTINEHDLNLDIEARTLENIINLYIKQVDYKKF